MIQQNNNYLTKIENQVKLIIINLFEIQQLQESTKISQKLFPNILQNFTPL